MRIQKISVGELLQFVESDLYKNSINIPITPFRALSQSKNPRANIDDIALIIAIDDDEQIVGYIGALPDKLAHNPNLNIAWNSCWWVDSQKGKQLALPLLSSLLTTWNFNILFRELTDHTKKIILNLVEFEIVKPLIGRRFFVRLDGGNILPKKKSIFRFIRPVLFVIDRVFNSAWLSIVKSKRFFEKKTEHNVYFLDEIDQEISRFIRQIAGDETFHRTVNELNWILEYPWVVEGENAMSSRYYFSDYSRSFNNYLLKITSSSKIIGFLFITEHNGLVKIPYAYFNKKDGNIINNVIEDFLISKKAISFHTFHQLIIESFEKNPIYWHKKIIKKELVTSKFLKKELGDYIVLQDGDGDAVFT